MAKTFSYALVVLALFACSSDSDDDHDGSAECGTEQCRALSSLADELDCGPIDEAQCACDDGCGAEARAFIECLEQDVAQCRCEEPGRLNCEGGFKASEGPALCIAENDALERCRDR